MNRTAQIATRARSVFAGRFSDIICAVREDYRKFVRREEYIEQLLGIVGGESEPMGDEQRDYRHRIRQEPGNQVKKTLMQCDRERQRVIGREILEHADIALEKIRETIPTYMPPAELFALEAVVLLYGRPILALNHEGDLHHVPSFWDSLKAIQHEVEVVQQAVGRIQLIGHEEFEWVGTAFLISETCVVTTRSNVELFAQAGQSKSWRLRRGIQANINFAAIPNQRNARLFAVRSVLRVHDQYDLAILEIEPADDAPSGPIALNFMMLAFEEPVPQQARPVYLVGYPARDSRRVVAEEMARLFEDSFGTKCVQPGLLRRVTNQHGDVLEHDCGGLGATGGSCLVDLETHQVLGIHLRTRHNVGFAIPTWKLREDPFFQHAGEHFADHSTIEVETVKRKIDRLAQSHFWQSTRQTVDDLYCRAFGDGPHS